MNAAGLIERAREAERLGDTNAYEGDLSAAKAWFGEAIDSFLQARAFPDAVRTCRKVIRVAPDVVRARFTLVFLHMGDGKPDEARAELAGYAEAVRASGAGASAVPHLRLLGHAAGDPELRAAISSLVSEFDHADAARHQPSSALGEVDARARWERLLETVLQDRELNP